MMTDILPPNFTMFPNIFFDYWMKHLSPTEFVILSCIARKTFGWGKKIDYISLRQLEEMSSLSRSTITKCLDHLIILGLIIKIRSIDEKDGSDAPNQYCINVIGENQDNQNLPPPGPKFRPPPVQNLDGGGVQNLDTQKKDLTKEINTKERIGLAPSCVHSNFSSNDKKTNITDIISTDLAKKIKFGEYVEYTQQEYDQLIKDFSKEEVDQAISEIEDWYPDRDKKKNKWQSGFYRGTRRWIRTMREKAKQNKFSPRNIVQTQEDLFKIINKRRDESSLFFSNNRIKLEQKGIRFAILEKAIQINNDIIDFRDNKFIELMKHALSKNAWDFSSKQK